MEETLHPIRIIVLDRGFVMVCRCPDPEEFGFWLPVTHSRTIRDWGTQGKGLGQLAQGPTENTVLDVMIEKESYPIRAILRVIEVEQTSWESYLNSGQTQKKDGERVRRGVGTN